ncbi:hypothetical protein DS079_09495 [Brachybacterium paraconglomeratum]|uniref:Uncharacterized protein n=1 Tax=Brachybacterium paraconglomeratum TaxID=173362 RepID=A0A426SJP7_9MICO|nr:hypothetical protein DS079_09495 [Brachybacterium paraconglomeratum]
MRISGDSSPAGLADVVAPDPFAIGCGASGLSTVDPCADIVLLICGPAGPRQQPTTWLQAPTAIGVMTP